MLTALREKKPIQNCLAFYHACTLLCIGVGAILWHDIAQGAQGQSLSSKSISSTYKDWTIDCRFVSGSRPKPTPFCHLQSHAYIVQYGKKEKIAAVTAARSSMVGKVYLFVQVPSSIDKTKKSVLRLSNGKEVAILTYQSCKEQFCLLQAEISDARFSWIVRDKGTPILYVPYPSSEQKAFFFSRDGIEQAYSTFLRSTASPIKY